MTAPQIIERSLTINFAQSVNVSTGEPSVMEVALLPLNDASGAGGTFAGGLRSVQLALSDPINPVVFDLIPSNSPGLSNPIEYRVMWRAGVMGRTFTYDFAMPDSDLTFDQLQASLGGIIDGERYLQQTDLGVPGRVARLNDQGIPMDSAGNPVITSSEIATLTSSLNVERVARQQGDAQVQSNLENEITTQVNSTLAVSKAYTDNQITTVSDDITTERSSRINADDDLQAQIITNNTTVTGLTTTLTNAVATINSTLTHKADLDNTGHVPLAQLPDTILTNAFPAADQAAMLALSPSLVHKGSLAVRPDSVWILTTNDPSSLANWTNLTTVSSVNNKRGVVTLSASDVGAIPTGGAIALGQVTGLTTALSNKADQTALNTTNANVAAIMGDTTLVHTVSGVIPYTLLDSNMVYLNNVGQLVKKDGTIIPVGGSGGGSVFSVNSKTGTVVLTAADVGAVAPSALTGKVDLDGSNLISIPTSKVVGLNTALALKADLVSGTIPLGQIPTLPTSQVTNLSAIISGNQLGTSSGAINRIASLESRVTTVEGGGGGGGGGTSSTSVFYDSSFLTTAVTDFTQVSLHSPWGVDSDGTITGTVGTWYYLRTGVRSTDVAYPFVTQNGHLQLRKINEANPSDPVFALQSDLAALTTTVSGKASQSDLTALTATVATKASTSALTTLSTTVDTKASQADLNSTNTAVAGKASAADLATTNAAVAGKASQSDFNTLSTTVSGKADGSALTTLTGRVTTAENALTTKADLAGGVLASGQIPNVPQVKVIGLAATLAAKADLSSGTVPLVQLPSIPQTQVTGLGTTLGAKADLVSGVVPLSQLPAAAVPNVVQVANRAALLALTTSQVQFGDLAIITGTSDKGSYVLAAADPSIFTNWVGLSNADAPVTSVNSKTGTVVLSASDVGAIGATASIPQSQITGLTSALATFATSTALTTGLAAKTSFSDVQSMFFNSSMVKKADYVAATSIGSLAGLQSVDGVLAPAGAIVLATSQSSSVNNGLWIVSSSGSWVRPADFATGSFLAKDTIVIVANSTAGANGVTNPYTIWQESATSGFIDANTNNWTRIAYAAPPFVPTPGLGIDVAGTTFTAKIDTGKGIVVTSSGLATDNNLIPRKFIGTVPSGSTVAGITHGLNSLSPTVSIWDTASNTLVLAGVTATSVNSISIEFNSAPASGQYRVVVLA